MKENKKNVITIIVAVTLLLVFVIGLTYALFTFTGRGQRVNQVTTTSVTMSYSEAVNGITLTNAMPISDAAGIVLSDSNQTFEFTVSVVTGSSVSVAWEVAAEKLTGSTLTNTDVRIYLEKKLSTDVNYNAVSSPSNFIPESTDSVIGTQSGEMILDQDSTTSSATYNYLLRMWVAESYELDENERTFSVKINVYGKDNYKSASNISLNKNSTTITVGNTETLTATVTPNDAYNGDVTWSSSDTSVATVSSSGVVTGMSVGSAVITAKTKNGKIATCSVEINNKLWLYNEGDEFTYVTGGWSYGGRGSYSVTKNSNNISLNGTFVRGSHFGDTYIYTNNLINEQSYTKIYVEYGGLSNNCPSPTVDSTAPYYNSLTYYAMPGIITDPINNMGYNVFSKEFNEMNSNGGSIFYIYSLSNERLAISISPAANSGTCDQVISIKKVWLE